MSRSLYSYLVLSVIVLALLPGVEGKSWALLAATANSWFNYGMQSDVYHAYQVIREGGIPDENIVVMFYDDIAEDENNPFKGKVFQSYDLKDVYKGVPKDYTGKDVNKEVLQAVLRGDRDAVKNLTGRDGKVIDSGPEDNVFVFLDNHGEPGAVCFWNYNDMTAKEFNQTIAYMHANRRYNKMVIYIDTCYSGSMFENVLPTNIGVYAVSAANATDVAWNTDCACKYFTKGTQTCLGGLFSVNWVYALESDDRRSTTLDQQFRMAKIACDGQSTPTQYGDLSIAKSFQSEFFGYSSNNPNPPPTSSSIARHRRNRRSVEDGAHSSVPKHMLAYYSLKNALSRLSTRPEQFEQVSRELARVEYLMEEADKFIADISARVDGVVKSKAALDYAKKNFGAIKWSCYEPFLDVFKQECPGLSHREEVRYYAASQFGVVNNLCDKFETRRLLQAAIGVARESHVCQM